jgi:hypothetical protein
MNESQTQALAEARASHLYRDNNWFRQRIEALAEQVAADPDAWPGNTVMDAALRAAVQGRLN